MPRLELLTTELVDRATFFARSNDRVGFPSTSQLIMARRSARSSKWDKTGSSGPRAWASAQRRLRTNTAGIVTLHFGPEEAIACNTSLKTPYCTRNACGL
jgi:hypothetical protein